MPKIGQWDDSRESPDQEMHIDLLHTFFYLRTRQLVFSVNRLRRVRGKDSMLALEDVQYHRPCGLRVVESLASAGDLPIVSGSVHSSRRQTVQLKVHE